MVENYTDIDTIFVSIASYRDNKCSTTIDSLFTNANKPNNIWVGLCEQNKKDDQPCFSEKWKNRIRTIRLPYWDAKGPTWARYLCSSLINGERYFLQIDSHSLFKKDWDLYLVKTIKELQKMGFDKSVLSHYIRSDKYYDSQDKQYNSVTKIPTICTSSFNKEGMIVLDAARDIDVNDTRPKPNAYISGHMLFGPTNFVKDVPFDPNLPYLFMGEEILYSIRLWTSGWNIFTPTKNVIYHYYIRGDDPKFWSDIKDVDNNEALNKVKYLLGLECVEKDEIDKSLRTNLDIYGLGKERSLKQYYDFIGLNKNIKDAHSNNNFCNRTTDELYTLLKNFDSYKDGNNDEFCKMKKRVNKTLNRIIKFFTYLFVLVIIYFMVINYKNIKNIMLNFK